MSYSLITGASSGIGYEIARLFAKNKHNLVLVSRSENRLNQVADNFTEEFKINVLTIPIDLSKSSSALEIYNYINKNNISINYLVNNAGFYIKGPFYETSWEEEAKLIQQQCLTHSHLTKLLLPDMIKKNQGGILNIGSTGSFVPGPNNAIYCAAKSFVLSFSQALAEELSKTRVNVTTLCPGGTKTNFQKFKSNRNTFLFPIMTPEKVAKIAYKALMKGKRIVIPGIMNKIQIALVKILPGIFSVKLAGKAVSN